MEWINNPAKRKYINNGKSNIILKVNLVTSKNNIESAIIEKEKSKLIIKLNNSPEKK